MTPHLHTSTPPHLHTSTGSLSKNLLLEKFLFIVFMMVFSLFVGYGCIDKDEFNHENGLSTPDKSAYLKYVHKQFADQQNLTTRSGDYSTSESIDFLNEGLNFMYCRPDTSYAESLFYLDTISIPLNGSGKVDEEDLEYALEEIATFAGGHYHAEQRGDKIPVMFNVRQLVTSPSMVFVEATFVMEAGANNLTADIYPYEHEWIYGQWGQDVAEECNELEVNADAADLFRRDLRKELAYRTRIEPPYFFKNPYSVCFSPTANNCVAVEIPIDFYPADLILEGLDLDNEDDPTSNDNLFEGLLFYNSTGQPNFHTCLSVDEMNFHYESMKKLCSDILPNPVGNSVISQIEVGYDLLTGSTIFHSMVATRVNKTVIIHEEHELAIPLPD